MYPQKKCQLTFTKEDLINIEIALRHYLNTQTITGSEQEADFVLLHEKFHNKGDSMIPSKPA